MALRRRRAVVWPLLVPFALVTLISAFGYGTIRFRVPAEVSIVVLAAVAIDALWRRRRSRQDHEAGAEAGT